jgi:hypothetical protein
MLGQFEINHGVGMSGGAPHAMKITFTAETAEIAEQEPEEFSACSAVHFLSWAPGTPNQERRWIRSS